MIFTDIPAGTGVFVDANTLVYHFAADPQFGPPCTELVKRIANKEVLGFASTHVLSDVAHRLMTVEAMLLFGWPAASIAHVFSSLMPCFRSWQICAGISARVRSASTSLSNKSETKSTLAPRSWTQPSRSLNRPHAMSFRSGKR
jgi:hypothetical protein